MEDGVNTEQLAQTSPIEIKGKRTVDDIGQESNERYVTLESLGVDSDSQLSLDSMDALERSVAERPGYSWFNGGSPLDYPRMGFSDERREQFLRGLAPAVASLFEDIPSLRARWMSVKDEPDTGTTEVPMGSPETGTS